MGKQSKEQLARQQGMAYALRLVQEKGVEALEKEMQMRGIANTQGLNIPLGVSREGVQKLVEDIKLNTLDTILIMSLWVMHKEFGFGTKRMNQYTQAFNKEADYLADDFFTWGDLKRQLLEECGIRREIRWFGQTVKNEESDGNLPWEKGGVNERKTG